MATVAHTIAKSSTFGDNHRVVTWTPLTTTNRDGQPFEMPAWSDRCVQIGGTFSGGAATVTLEGSNDGVTWFTLTDPQGNVISATAAKMEQVMEVPRFTRPNLTGGDGSTSITVTLLAVKKGRV
jgi:hypothetical protein